MVWLVIYLYFILPYVVFTLLIGSTLFFTFKPVLHSLPLITSKKKPVRIQSALSLISILLLVAGIGLLLYFWYVGGPNRGAGRHIFANGTDLYADMQIGMLLIFMGTAISVVVRALFGHVKKIQLLRITVVVIVMLIAVTGYILRGYDTHAKIVHMQKEQVITKLASLPPIYVPNSILSHVPPPSGKPFLIGAGGNKEGYDLSLFNQTPFEMVVGWHQADVNSFFDPSADKCDINGLQWGHPATTSGLCQVIASMNGGVLYGSTQISDTNRPEGAFVKGNAVYFVSAGQDRSDLVSAVSQLQLISTQQAEQYLNVAL